MAKYKIEIDREACIGDEQCCADAEGTFEMDDEGKTIVKDPEGNTPDEILEAAKNCPTDAIILYDVESGDKVWPEE
jgi:ferredoxin